MTRVKNGPPAQPPIKDERIVSRQGDGSTRDRAEYDNGRVRYDWDNYTDAQGDHRGLGDVTNMERHGAVT